MILTKKIKPTKRGDYIYIENNSSKREESKLSSKDEPSSSKLPLLDQDQNRKIFDFKRSKIEVASMISMRSIGCTYPPHSPFPLNFVYFENKK